MTAALVVYVPAWVVWLLGLGCLYVTASAVVRYVLMRRREREHLESLRRRLQAGHVTVNEARGLMGRIKEPGNGRRQHGR